MHSCFPLREATTEIGDGSGRGGEDRTSQDRANPNPNIVDLLQKLNLMVEEGDVAYFNDDEGEGKAVVVEFALLGKVLSPLSQHANTIRAAMKSALGNPYGMKIRSIGEKGDNLFVAEFGSKVDMEQVLAGSPWIAGKHTVILKEYDEKIKLSEICFDRMDIWLRILNLPLGWMNQHRGVRAIRLLGQVKRMDVDGDGKVIKRGVLLRMTRDGEPEWFDAQYKKLPLFCFSCGMMAH